MSRMTAAEKYINKGCAPLPAEGFARLPMVLAHIPMGRSAWYLGVKSGIYPQPVKIGPRAAAWRVEDIRKLIADLSEQA